MSKQDMFIPKLLGKIINKILTEEDKFKTKEIIEAVKQEHSSKNGASYTLAKYKVEAESDAQEKPEKSLDAFVEEVNLGKKNPDGVLVVFLVVTG